MGQINKIRLLGKTIQSQKPTFSKPSKMEEAQVFSLTQLDTDGNSIGDFDFDISLRSLKSFNGSVPICDEILIDLVEQRTFHIRRVGVCILDSLTGVYNANGELFNGYAIPTDSESDSAFEPNSYIHSYCDKMCTQESEIESFNANREFCGNLNSDTTDKWFFRIKASTVGKNTNIGFSEWSQSTQITIYAKLQEPIITEIGHIELDPSAVNFKIYSPESYNKLVPDLVVEYEKDYEVAINEVETEIDSIETIIAELQSLKSNKPVTTSIKIDTPVFSKVLHTCNSAGTPTGEALNSSFTNWLLNYYYVTLKETTGTALTAGVFKLADTKDGFATAINQYFTFNDGTYNTGNSGLLTENTRVDFKTIGASWSLRLRDAYQLIIPIPQALQLSDWELSISGLIKNTYYLYFEFYNQPELVGTNMYFNSGANSGYTHFFIFPSGSGQNKKFVFNNTILRLYRKQREINAEFQFLHSGSNTLGGATTYTSAVTNATAYRIDRADIKSVPIQNIKIWGGENGGIPEMTFSNGTEITIKELL